CDLEKAEARYPNGHSRGLPRRARLLHSIKKKTGNCCPPSFLKDGERVGVRRFELPTPTSLTWCANRAALHPEHEPATAAAGGPCTFRKSGANIEVYFSIAQKKIR